jgi:hypothetical protein
VAAPYGAAIGVGSLGVGLLMAADPLGSVVGAWLLARINIPKTRTSVVLLAACSGVPLVLCASGPGLGLSILLWAISGIFSTAYLIIAQAIVVELIPDHRRGRVLGRISTCLYTSQGLAILAGGFAAEATGPFRAIAGAGLLGIVLVLCVGEWWRRVARSRRDLAAGSERGLAEGERNSHVLGSHDGHLLADRTEHGFVDREPRSHVLGRHEGHLLPERTERGFENQRNGSHILGRHDSRLLADRTEHGFEDGSHVLGSHDGHLLADRTEHGFEDWERRSHVLGRHEGHLLPERTERGFENRKVGSHVLGRHHGHLLPHRTRHEFERWKGRSHVLGRHGGHLLPNWLARTTSVTRSNELSLVRELSSGSRALSLWVFEVRTLRNRMGLRRVARA